LELEVFAFIFLHQVGVNVISLPTYRMRVEISTLLAA